MKVVFLEEVEGTARAGDVKNVADGFARNFLLPRKLAAPATQHYISIANAKATKEARKQDRLDAEARERLLPLVDGKSLTIEVRVGEQDKLFGSVTTRDIAEALQALTKVEVEHRQVDLKQPLREVGEHKVPVKLTRNVIATVTVNVEPIGGAAAEEAPAAEVEAPEAEAAAEEAPEAEPVAGEPAAEESTTEGTEDEGDKSTESS
jgi:large subunit ribosomal protein L9